MPLPLFRSFAFVSSFSCVRVCFSICLFVSCSLYLCLSVSSLLQCFFVSVSLSLSLCRFFSLFLFFLVSVVRAYFSIYLVGFNCIFGHRGWGALGAMRRTSTQCDTLIIRKLTLGPGVFRVRKPETNLGVWSLSCP